MADELIDILDKTGKPTGVIQWKSKAHQMGLYHASVHIWLYTADGDVLLQKRAKNKDTYPNLWDISVAGHIGAGETPKTSAIREVKEEIGLTITENDLEFISIYLAKKKPQPAIIDNEFHHIYLVHLYTEIKDLTLQKEEVSDIKLYSIKKLKKELEDPKLSKLYVPHSPTYFKLVLNKIINRLKQ